LLRCDSHRVSPQPNLLIDAANSWKLQCSCI
jgi:hypothetical protein